MATQPTAVIPRMLRPAATSKRYGQIIKLKRIDCKGVNLGIPGLVTSMG